MRGRGEADDDVFARPCQTPGHGQLGRSRVGIDEDDNRAERDDNLGLEQSEREAEERIFVAIEVKSVAPGVGDDDGLGAFKPDGLLVLQTPRLACGQGVRTITAGRLS